MVVCYQVGPSDLISPAIPATRQLRLGMILGLELTILSQELIDRDRFSVRTEIFEIGDIT